MKSSENARRKPARLVAVLLPILLYALFRFSVGPLLPGIQNSLYTSVAIIGTLTSASTLDIGIGTAITGYFVSKIGEQKTVVLGLVIFSLALGASSFARTLAFFAPFFIISGLGCGLMTTPTYSMAATIFPSRKGAAIGLVSATFNLGGFVGPTFSGILLSYLGWQYPFLVMAILGILFIFLFRFGLSKFKTPSEKTSTLKKDLMSLIASKNILVIGVTMFLTDLGFFAYVTYTIGYFSERFSLFGGALVPIDLYFGLAIAIGSLGAFLLGLLYDRVGGKFVAVLVCAVIAISSFALFSGENLLIAISLIFVIGLFLNSPFGILSILAQANVPSYLRASAVSFVQTAAFAGGVLGLAVAAVLFGKNVNASPLVATVAVPYTISAIIMAALYSTNRALKISN